MERDRRLFDPRGTSNLSRRHVLAVLTATGASGCSGLTDSGQGGSQGVDDGTAVSSASDSASISESASPSPSPSESASPSPSPSETSSPTPEPVPTVAFSDDELNPGFSQEAWRHPESFELPFTTVSIGRRRDEFSDAKLLLEKQQEEKEGEDGNSENSNEVEQVEKQLKNGKTQVKSNEIADGTYKAILENESGERVEPEPHEGQEDVEIVKDSVDHKRIDVHTPDTEEKTPYRHDNYTHKPGEFKKEYEDKWTRDAAYTGEYVENDPGLIQKLKKDEDITGVAGYPNPKTEYGFGHWDLQKFKDTGKLGNLVDWIQPAVRTQTALMPRNLAPSDDNDHMAASIELAVDRLHPDANVEAGYLEQGGHGGVIVYSPLENIDGEHHFHHVDTASGESAPVDEADELLDEQYYNPFIEGYHHDQGQFDYGKRKSTALQGIANIIRTFRTEDITIDNFTVSDQLAETFYNEKVANNESADEFFDDIREAMGYTVNDGDQTLVYGTADDVRVAEVGDELFADANSSEAYLDVETVEGRLGSAAS